MNTVQSETYPINQEYVSFWKEKLDQENEDSRGTTI